MAENQSSGSTQPRQVLFRPPAVTERFLETAPTFLSPLGRIVGESGVSNTGPVTYEKGVHQKELTLA